AVRGSLPFGAPVQRAVPPPPGPRDRLRRLRPRPLHLRPRGRAGRRRPAAHRAAAAQRLPGRLPPRSTAAARARGAARELHGRPPPDPGALGVGRPDRPGRGRPCVLKVSRHVGETRNEIAALRLWGGRGAARLLDADPEVGALLVERLEPGTMLVEVAQLDDAAATTVAAGVLRRLWRPLPA